MLALVSDSLQSPHARRKLICSEGTGLTVNRGIYASADWPLPDDWVDASRERSFRYSLSDVRLTVAVACVPSIMAVLVSAFEYRLHTGIVNLIGASMWLVATSGCASVAAICATFELRTDVQMVATRSIFRSRAVPWSRVAEVVISLGHPRGGTIYIATLKAANGRDLLVVQGKLQDFRSLVAIWRETAFQLGIRVTDRTV